MACGLLGLLVLGLCGAVSYPSAREAQLLGSTDLAQHWSQGDVVMLVRHAERCDRTDAPCLGAEDGITVRGGEIASTLGRDYRDYFGLGNADIYASPLTRTTQTASLMFGSGALGEAWVADCKGDLLNHVLEHKASHRNLILVTHSECMEQLAKALGQDNLDTPDYTTSLVLFSDGRGGLQLAGEIDAADWAHLQVR
ncbi:histidine phosphatase family protein [Pseudomonas citronellolis]|nr:histidine phosphatase family protein [Pseudomonas citronellolis]MDF3931226.1 histidine phosphatase family protein [Pseudomonas citronellolis]